MHSAGECEGRLVPHAIGKVPTEVEEPGEEGLEQREGGKEGTREGGREEEEKVKTRVEMDNYVRHRRFSLSLPPLPSLPPYLDKRPHLFSQHSREIRQLH